MNITKVRNAKKVGIFYLSEKKGLDKIEIEFQKNISSKVLTEQRGHVYIIVSDNEIKKIGGTRAKGGIKAAMRMYVNSKEDSPSLRSFGIHLLIERELKNKKKLELWLISNPRVKTKIFGLTKADYVKVAAFKESENLCKNEYRLIKKKFPPWNFQENKEKWPEDIRQKHRANMNKK